MRVAAIYDIHANLPALEAVLAEVRRENVDLILVGGDVLPGPMPRETMNCLRQLDIPAQFILGNGDREVMAASQGTETTSLPARVRATLRWTASCLLPEDETLIAGWPAMRTVPIDGLGDVLFCHATPRNDTEIFTRRTAEDRLLPVFGGLDVSLVVCGHTHMQFDMSVGRIRVVNAGSVGMPFGQPGAYWLILGPDVQLRYSTFDLAAAAHRIRQTGYPEAQEFATGNILQPPPEDATLDAFSRIELQ